MPPKYGTDTSVLVRLLTGQPESEFEHCVRELRALTVNDDAQIFASNQAIGEAYIAVQHHYGVAEAEARSGLLRILTGGVISPLSGRSVLDALAAIGAPGLMDRLIDDGYYRAGLEVLTLDRRMSRLPNSRLL